MKVMIGTNSGEYMNAMNTAGLILDVTGFLGRVIAKINAGESLLTGTFGGESNRVAFRFFDGETVPADPRTRLTLELAGSGRVRATLSLPSLDHQAELHLNNAMMPFLKGVSPETALSYKNTAPVITMILAA